MNKNLIVVEKSSSSLIEPLVLEYIADLRPVSWLLGEHRRNKSLTARTELSLAREL